MSHATVKLQIPLDRTLRDQVEKHAREQGFSSIQDFTRVMYSTLLRENLRVSLKGTEEQLSPEVIKRLDYQAEKALRDHKAGKLKSYDNVEEFLASLKD